MRAPRTPLEQLASEMARAQDAALEGQALPPLRRRSPPRLRPRFVAAVSLAAAAVAAMLVLMLRAPTLTVEVDGQLPADPVAWISVAPEAEKPLRFSDGSTLLLGGGARARVLALTTRGAHVQIERGQAVVSVPHRQGTEWQLEAGPFTVEVTGTRFNVSWVAAEEEFRLTMLEGAVHVRGPGLPDMVVVAGQTLTRRIGASVVAAATLVPVAPPAVEATPLAARFGAAPLQPPRPDAGAGATPAIDGDRASPSHRRAITAAAKSSPTALVAPPPAVTKPPPTTAPATTPPAGPTTSDEWRTLGAAGRYRDALTALRASNLDDRLATAGGDDLLLISDAARLGSDVTLARRALETARHRFAGSPAAARACFMLGRLAFDADTQTLAATWFGRYLDEAPDGPLAREALGRLIESLEREGDHPTARRRAEQYLQRYPTGPHAALARSLLPR